MGMLFRVIALFALLLPGAPGQAWAQTGKGEGSYTSDATAQAVPNTPEATRDMVARLSDQQVRQLLLERLDAEEKKPQAPPVAKPLTVSETIDGFVNLLVASAIRIAHAAVATPENTAAGMAAISAYINGCGRVRFLGVFAVALASGGLAEWVVIRAIRSGRKGLPSDAAPASAPTSARAIARQFLLDCLGLVIFFVVMTIMLIMLLPEQSLALARLVAVWLILFPRFAMLILHILLAPDRPVARPANADDQSARFVYRNATGLVFLIGFGLSCMGILNLTNVAASAAQAGFCLNLIVFIGLGVVLYRGRGAFTAIIRGRSDELSDGERWMVRAYPAYSLTLLILPWLIGVMVVTAGAERQITGGQHLLTMMLLLVLPLFDTGIRAAVHLLPRSALGSGGMAAEALLASHRSFTRIGRAVRIGVVVLILTMLWDVKLNDVVSVGMGANVSEAGITSISIALFGYLIWEISDLWVNRVLARENTGASFGTPQDENNAIANVGENRSRLATIMPIVGITLKVTILVMTILVILVILGNLGINVIALVAGAGVLGLAIGFGSQQSVSDIVSGMFFLLDDAFRVGEHVDVGSVEGTVEKFSLRSLRLRDAKGPIYRVPYDSIPRVTNFSRDWGIEKIKFTVPFDMDVDRVRRIFKKIGQEMLENPELAPGFVEPFKSSGVSQINQTGIVIGSKFTHKPGTQYLIQREIYRQVQKKFEEAGIKFARQEVRVAVSGGDLKLDDPRIEAATAAAVSATKEEQTKEGA